MVSDISVIIPFYGDPQPTRALIDALGRQRIDGDLQIIVADDCSPTPFPVGPGYEVVRRKTNGGFGSAVNSGVEHATGDVLLVLNSDLSLGDTFVTQFVDAAEPWQPAVCAPRVVEPRGDNAVANRWPKVRHHLVEWLEPLARWHGTATMSRLLGHDVRMWGVAQDMPTDWLIGACLLIPTSYFREVGGFDETFFMNSEECDLQRRLADIGVGRVYLPQISVEHGAGGSSDPAKRIGWVVDSWVRYQRKWGHPRSLRLGLLAVSVLNLVWNVGRRAKGEQIRSWNHFVGQVNTVEYAWRVSR